MLASLGTRWDCAVVKTALSASCAWALGLEIKPWFAKQLARTESLAVAGRLFCFVNGTNNWLRLARRLTLLVLLTAAGCDLNAQSPSTVAGRTFQMAVSSGSFPFASSGAFRALPSALDTTYAIVPISGNISASTGTYTYTKTGASTATLSFADSVTGTLTASCTFNTASSGSYVLTSTSFPGGSQTGTFFMYSGTSPASLSGYTVTVTITSGASPFATSGSYRFLPAASGNTYNVAGIVGVVNSSGTYSYTKNSATTGYFSYNDSVSGPGFTSQLSFDSATTGTLYLQNSSSGGYQTGVFTGVPPAAPTISVAPQGQTAGVGNNVTFTVAANGVGTLSYQWRKNSSNLGGATGSSYTINNVQTGDAGSYDVIVSNIGGSTPSETATLTVVVPPSITAPPASQTVVVGRSLYLTESVSGSSPLSYQWRRNGANISAATNATYSVISVQASHAGNYEVVVSNSGGSVTSAPPAVLTVTLPQPGTVRAWGRNDFGQTAVPANLSRVLAVTAGYSHTVALKDDGTLSAWGSNGEGQLTVPAAAQSGVMAVAAGYYHTVALKTGGSVVAWGRNVEGQTTVPVAAQSGVIAVAAGGYHTIALKTDGTLVTWGRGDEGQTTVPVAAQTGVAAIAAGEYHTVALKSSGAVVAWGHNGFGQSTVPASASGGVVALGAGGYHSAALKADGSVVAWGDNLNGQTTVPTAAQSGVVAIAVGHVHTVALKSNGSVVAWGLSGNGQTNVPLGLAGGLAISAGGYHSVAVTSSPLLAASSTGASLTLLWPDSSGGFRVESALSLSPPVTWSTEPGSLQTNGGSISVGVPITGVQKFYRLSKP